MLDRGQVVLVPALQLGSKPRLRQHLRDALHLRPYDLLVGSDPALEAREDEYGIRALGQPARQHRHAAEVFDPLGVGEAIDRLKECETRIGHPFDRTRAAPPGGIESGQDAAGGQAKDEGRAHRQEQAPDLRVRGPEAEGDQTRPQGRAQQNENQPAELRADKASEPDGERPDRRCRLSVPSTRAVKDGPRAIECASQNGAEEQGTRQEERAGPPRATLGQAPPSDEQRRGYGRQAAWSQRLDHGEMRPGTEIPIDQWIVRRGWKDHPEGDRAGPGTRQDDLPERWKDAPHTCLAEAHQRAPPVGQL